MPTVYLIPSVLSEEGINSIPSYIIDAIKNCQVFFVENERTTRRYFKELWKAQMPGKEIVIDNFEWVVMTDGATLLDTFKKKIKEGKNIGIVSEAGCPGVADPGQALIALAQNMKVEIKPLVGPSAILLALMASGMNGQHFQFVGYLPIDNQQRIKAIKDLENESAKKKCTQIFIETPYRNNQLSEALFKTCLPTTKICIAAELTSANEYIKTNTVADWRKEKTDFHKKPVIFLLMS
jgi:16S rRNA (cytidine1402-2'-O)-methyltransferase